MSASRQSCSIRLQTKFPVQTESGAPDTLASIALISKTSIEEIKPLAAQVDLLMQELLGGIIPADPSFAFPDGRVEPNRTGFPGLLGDPGTETALRVLDERYEKVGLMTYSNAGQGPDPLEQPPCEAAEWDRRCCVAGLPDCERD